MTAQSLAEFLLARIAEDETRVHVMAHLGGFAEGWGLDRMLAECEAKRRTVDIHDGWHVCPYGDWSTGNRGTTDFCDNQPGLDACPTARLLALPYADHSDYQPEWRV